MLRLYKDFSGDLKILMFFQDGKSTRSCFHIDVHFDSWYSRWHISYIGIRFYLNIIRFSQFKNLKLFFPIFLFEKLFHPLELIKVRYQVDEYSKPKLFNYFSASTQNNERIQTKTVYRPEYRNMIDTLKKIYKTENGLKGLYRVMQSFNQYAKKATKKNLFKFY
jgi:hypothetical protein